MKVIIIAATTIDGKIAKHTAHNVNWTSKQDKQFFRSEVKRAGVVIFGSNTYRAMGGPMSNCLNIVMTRNPSALETLFMTSQKDAMNHVSTNLLFTSDAPQTILDNLKTQGYTKVIIGGGSIIYSLFLEQGFVDEIYLTIAPTIFGQGINFFKDMNIGQDNVGVDDIDLELISVGKLGKGEVLLKYQLKK